MGNAIGIDMKNIKEEESVDIVINAVKALSMKIGIPSSLRELNVKEEDLPLLAREALNDVCTPGNPRHVNENDLLNLFKEAY